MASINGSDLWMTFFQPSRAIFSDPISPMIAPEMNAADVRLQARPFLRLALKIVIAAPASPYPAAGRTPKMTGNSTKFRTKSPKGMDDHASAVAAGRALSVSPKIRRTFAGNVWPGLLLMFMAFPENSRFAPFMEGKAAHNAVNLRFFKRVVKRTARR